MMQDIIIYFMQEKAEARRSAQSRSTFRKVKKEDKRTLNL